MTTLSKGQTKLLTDTVNSGSEQIKSPDNIRGFALALVLESLVKNGFAKKVDDHFVITNAGRQAVGAKPLCEAIFTETINPDYQEKSITKKPRKGTKQAMLVRLLQRPQGTTMDEMVKITMWQKHTVRGTLSHTIKKRLGYLVESAKNADNVRIYRIVEA